MHIAVAQVTRAHTSDAQDITAHLLPALAELREKMFEKQQKFEDIVKIGRTHLMDAVPLTMGEQHSLSREFLHLLSL